MTGLPNGPDDGSPVTGALARRGPGYSVGEALTFAQPKAGIPLLIKKLSLRIRRFAWRILTAVQPDRMHAFRLPDGARFDYPLRTAVGADLFAGGFEPAEVEFFRRHVKPGDVVLDIGANAGLYTVLAARAVGESGHVYAFEPDPRAVALLRNNIEINNLANVTVIEAAASNRSGTAALAAATDTAMSSLADIDRQGQQIQEWRTVRTIRVDDAVEAYDIRSVTFIKMDVEGAEKLVLEGASSLLGRASNITILFEGFDQNTHAFGYTVRELLDALTSQGFSLQGFDRSLQLHPVDRLRPEIGRTVYNFVGSRT